MAKQTGMLYNGRQEIGIDELARINTALLTACDFLYVNANYSVSQANFESYEHICMVMDSYIKAGLVQLWDYPGDKQLDGVEILSEHDYMHWAKQIDKSRQKESIAQLDKYLNHASSPLERSSMLVDLKKEYWQYAICNMLKADQIMFTQLSKQMELELSQFKEYQYATIREPFVLRIFEITDINTRGLALLSASQMKKQIKAGKEFREYISRIQNGECGDTDYINHELNIFMKHMSKEYSQKLSSLPQSILGHSLNCAAFCTAPGVSLLSSIVSLTKGVADDITSRKHDKKSLLHFTARLGKITRKANDEQPGGPL